MAFNATAGVPPLKDAPDSDAIKAPVYFNDEWNRLHKLFPQSSLSVQNSISEECAVVVPLSVERKECELSFSLTSNYPFEVPYIDLNSSVMSKSEINDVLRTLDLMCAGSIGQSMITPCIEEAMNCLQEPRGGNQKLKGKRIRNHKKQNKKSPKIQNMDDENEFSEDNVISMDISSKENIVTTNHNQTMKQGENNLANEPNSLPRPNYFIAIRVTDENLIEKLVTIQNALVEQESLLTKGVIPSTALHITLCNLGLFSADDLVKAMEALRKMKTELEGVLPTSPLIIHGASQFYDRAIYAKVESNEEFLAFRETLIRKLDVAGIVFCEDHEQYTPHVTMIKVRRPERRMFGNRPIRPAIYSSFLESIHGEQIIDAVYLCAMDGNKRPDGFYVTPYELQFGITS